jgi:hypothetical protein
MIVIDLVFAGGVDLRTYCSLVVDAAGDRFRSSLRRGPGVFSIPSLLLGSLEGQTVADEKALWLPSRADVHRIRKGCQFKDPS